MDATHATYDTDRIKIDGEKYSIVLLNTSETLRTGQEIIKLILPSAGAAMDGMFGEQDILADEPATFTSIAFHLVRQMGEFHTIETVKQLLEGSTVDGEPLEFETHFKGKFSVLIKLIEFAVKENYGSLFTDMGLKERLTSYTESLKIQTQGLLKEDELPSTSEKIQD